jgi:tRNA pseudouridine55 synthase
MNGILIVDKPRDWTSHDVAAKLRGVCHEKRVGHSGTLDPMATGVLAVFAGRATRAVEFAEADEKEYIAHLRLGVATDTQDITGQILKTADGEVSREELESVLGRFRGTIDQLPPMYSAIKINGQKLCNLARRGVEVERKARSVAITRLEVTGREDGDWILDVVCSKGTYIRALCNDIGQALGCGGCMSGLRRVRAGVFTIDMAHSIEEISETPEKYLLPADTLFAGKPMLITDGMQEKKLRCGADFSIPAEDGEYRFYSETGEFLMLGSVKDGTARTIKSFFEV